MNIIYNIKNMINLIKYKNIYNHLNGLKNYILMEYIMIGYMNHIMLLQLII
jgi:hypothetical protein